MNEWKRFKLTVEDSIASVVFDDTTAPVNTLGTPTIEEMVELLRILREMVERGEARAMVLVSGKPGNFLAGKDLSDDTVLGREEMLASLMQLHRLFTDIEELPVPTIVGINGFCLGGGFEFALSFRMRVAQDTARTRFGFPEIGLGILPGTGGTQRFPRLVGAPGVEILMSGRQLSAREALDIGAVDRVIPADADLQQECLRLARECVKERVPMQRPPVDIRAVYDAVDRAEASVKQMRGGYLIPGERAALRAMKEGLTLPIWEGLSLEANLFLDVNESPEAAGSMHSYNLKQRFGRPKGQAAYGERLQALAQQLGAAENMAALGRAMLDRGEVEEPDLIDAAAILYLSFPQEKGGPLKWEDLTGESERVFGKKFYP